MDKRVEGLKVREPVWGSWDSMAAILRQFEWSKSGEQGRRTAH